jgi:DNA-binding PadR family transcriptional regulator
MSAKHAVLGLVIERPGYGYDLARRLGERFASYGFAPTGVYSALDQLSSEAFVRAVGTRGDVGERAAPRTVYEATPAGVEAFERWMLSPSSLSPMRDELYMKLALSRPHDLPRLVELVRSQEEECLARLEQLAAPVAAAGARSRARGTSLAWSDVAALLVRDAEVKRLQARVEWLQKARSIMARVSPARGGETAEQSAAKRSAAPDVAAAQERVA